ncbi:MAG TPA: RNA polymerase sigma factor [Gemmatimonadales bacterium]|nr:RNA polymerase sigma factor [Gemmatimonadales bacterium]
MTEVTDGAVVARVLAGEVDAFAILVGRHRDRGFRYALHLLGNTEDAEDALQESLLRAFRALRRCRDPERFDAWFFRILVNRCRTRGARRKALEGREILDPDGLATGRVESRADGFAWHDAIAQALGELPADQREAFLLRHVEDVSYEDMSALTGVGVSALKMRVKRACDTLRDRLKDEEAG